MSNVTLKSGCVVRFIVDVDILDNIELVKEDFLSDMRKELSDASKRGFSGQPRVGLAGLF